MAPSAPMIMHHQAIHLPTSSTGDRLITVNAFNPINKAANDPSPPTPTNDSENPIASILLSLTCLSKSEREFAGIFEFLFHLKLARAENQRHKRRNHFIVLLRRAAVEFRRGRLRARFAQDLRQVFARLRRYVAMNQ